MTGHFVFVFGLGVVFWGVLFLYPRAQLISSPLQCLLKTLPFPLLARPSSRLLNTSVNGLAVV